MLLKPFPWQVAHWQGLLSAPGQLPHALLLAGPEGLGKRAFAQAVAARLLCESPVRVEDQVDGEQVALELACGRCSACGWMAAGTHPDFRRVQPEDLEAADSSETDELAQDEVPGKKASGAAASSSIGIAQIRALADFVFVGSYRHGCRVVLVEPAEAMTPAAANALLKILEEPPPSVYFLMISNAWRKLLPTIRSRCRMVLFGRPALPLATAWLRDEGADEALNLLPLTAGAPLLARDWAVQDKLPLYRKVVTVLADNPVDPVAMAAHWLVLVKNDDGFSLSQLVDAVQKWMFDLVQCKLSGEVRYHLDATWRMRLDGLAARASQAGLLTGYAELLRIRAVVRHPLNTQLFLEDLAARYIKAVARAV
jgi:DNA polymerase-3 subunit delta'